MNLCATLKLLSFCRGLGARLWGSGGPTDSLKRLRASATMVDIETDLTWRFRGHRQARAYAARVPEAMLDNGMRVAYTLRVW